MLKRIYIENFYNTVPKIDIEFHDKINVLIGDNGTFKTKLLLLLDSIYRGRGIESIIEHYFKILRIELETDQGVKLIEIIRHEEAESEYYEAHIRIGILDNDNQLTDSSNYVFRYEGLEKQTAYQARRGNSTRAKRNYISLSNPSEINKEIIFQLGQFYFTPLNAYSGITQSYDEVRSLGGAINKRVIREIVRCEKETGVCSQNFNKEMLKLLFENAGDSSVEDSQCMKINEKDIRSLNNALKRVDLVDDNLKKLIEKTLTAELDKTSSDYNISNKMIKNLISITKKMGNDLKKIWDRKDRLEIILNKLFRYSDYTFTFDSEKGMRIFRKALDSRQIELNFDDMSSGEKQLIGFFVTILFSNYSIIAIDEPENSLHIEWQEELLEYFTKANNKVQYICATHSNHFVKRHAKGNIKVFNMNKFFEGDN